MKHNKATPRANAANKATMAGHFPKQPRTPTSGVQLNQARFNGERALTGEDRPSDRAGEKRRGPDMVAVGGKAGRPAMRGQGRSTTPRRGSRGGGSPLES